VVLGQRATAEKSNEKTAIPELLATLALEGCIVTIDAMGTQTNIAKVIRDRGADYILAVKDNQPILAAPYALIGPWRTACIGAWMSSSPTIRCAPVPVMPPTTSPSLNTSPSLVRADAKLEQI